MSSRCRNLASTAAALFDSPAGEPGIAVRAVADQRQVVGDALRLDAELGDHAGLVVGDRAHPVAQDHPLAVHALGQVLVDAADDDLLDARVAADARDAGRDGVIGLVLDHRPGR